MTKAVRGKFNAFHQSKHKKAIGEAYPLQRFGVGDLLESPAGKQGVVTARRGAEEESDIMWPGHTSNVKWDNKTLYTYKGEKK